MTFIEELTQEFVSMYTSKNEKEIIHKARILVREIKRNEFQFMMTKHPYAVARALYYLLSDEAKLTDEESVPVAKLLYYCLLKNYLTNSNANASDANFFDLIGGCQLGVIFMTKYIKFVAFFIISDIAHYLPDAARKHAGNQLLLFCKTVCQAEITHNHHLVEDNLMREYDNFIHELNQHLPEVTDILALKHECTPVIEQICEEIRFDCALKDNDF